MIQNKWLDDKIYKDVFSKTPRICVDIILIKDKKFLLFKREIDPFKGYWGFPGGRVFHGERIINAVDRTVFEEMGTKCSNPMYFGYIEMLTDGEFLHTVSLVFLARTVSEKINESYRGGRIEAFDFIPDKMQPYQETFLKENWDKILKELQ